MNSGKKLSLLDDQIAAANDGKPSDFQQWWNRTDVVLRQIFGEDSPTHRKFAGVRYTPSVYFSGQDVSGYRPAGVRQVISILDSAKLEVELDDGDDDKASEAVRAVDEGARRVFVVHGHNESNKHELASFLRDLLDEDPIILHQQPNRGQVLIEKFEANASLAGFAVIVLSGDDEARSAGSESPLALRARQNVVFEMGFFFSALGRENVAVLYGEGVELPSDVAGIVYIPLDAAGAWKTQVARDMKDAGITVDLGALLK